MGINDITDAEFAHLDRLGREIREIRDLITTGRDTRYTPLLGQAEMAFEDACAEIGADHDALYTELA